MVRVYRFLVINIEKSTIHNTNVIKTITRIYLGLRWCQELHETGRKLKKKYRRH